MLRPEANPYVMRRGPSSARNFCVCVDFLEDPVEAIIDLACALRLSNEVEQGVCVVYADAGGKMRVRQGGIPSCRVTTTVVTTTSPLTARSHTMPRKLAESIMTPSQPAGLLRSDNRAAAALKPLSHPVICVMLIR
jgi:hypothetical protein